jgi:hypothetical protein
MKKIPENEIIGKKFNRLTVVKELDKRVFKSGSIREFLCICDCGKETKAMLNKLKNNNTMSCGCLRLELFFKKITTHGMTSSPEYQAWLGMKQRCYDLNGSEYKRYMVRGIEIYDEWIHDFQKFYEYIGKKPSKKHSIDRIDNNKGYFPGNVRWATINEQARNKRSNIIIEYKGEKKCITDWAKEINMNLWTLMARIKRNKWSIDRAIETPVRAIKKPLTKNV